MLKRPFSMLAISAYVSAMLAPNVAPSQTPIIITADITPAVTAAFNAVIYSISDELVKPADAQKAIESAKTSTPTPSAKSPEQKSEAKDAKTEKTPPAPPITKEAIEKLVARAQKGKEANLAPDVSQVLQLTAKGEKPSEVSTKQFCYRSPEKPNDPIYFGFVVDTGSLLIISASAAQNKMAVYRFSNEGKLIVASIADNNVVSEYKGEEAQKGFNELAATWNKLSEKLPAPAPKETVVASNDKGAKSDPTQKN